MKRNPIARTLLLAASGVVTITACGGASGPAGPGTSSPLAVGNYEMRTSPPFPGYTGDLQRVDTLVVTYATRDSIAGRMKGQSYGPAVKLGVYNITAYLIYINLYSGDRTVGVRIVPSPLSCTAQFVPSGEQFPCVISRVSQ